MDRRARPALGSLILGDEYAERTGRLRIGYTREEIILGLSRTVKRRWRPYAEGGWAYKNSSDVQAPGRLQAGLEYHDGRPALGEFFQRDENYVALGLWLDV